MSKKEDSSAAELSKISKALLVAEGKRFDTGLTPLLKKELEQASMVLRARERELISQIGNEIALSIKVSGEQLEKLSKNIRSSTTKMSKTTQSLEKVKKALLLISKL